MKEKQQTTIIQEQASIIENFGLGNLPIEQQVALIERMSGIVYKRVLLRIMDKLSEKDALEINALLGKKDYKKVDELIRDKVTDFITILKEEVERVRAEIIEKAGK